MIQATAPLAPDAERDLIALAQAGREAAMADLVRAHVRYLRAEARKYSASEPLLDADDMLSAGLEAFVKAVKSFDLSRPVRLLTHARPAIALAMDEEKAAVGRAISVPSRTLRRYRQAIRETDSLEDAREWAWKKEGRLAPDVFDAVHFAMTGHSLDAPKRSPHLAQDALSEERDAGSAEARPGVGIGSRGPSPEDNAIARALTRQALAVLDVRQRAVVVLAFLSGEDLSDAEIAERLLMSRPTVTRLRNAALAAMREVFAA